MQNAVQVGTPRRQTALEYVRERIQPDGQSAERMAFEQQWLGDLGLYAGSKFVSDGGMIRAARNLGAQRDAYNANLILPKVLTFLARKAAINPKMVVLPRTDEWEDMQAARLAMQAYEHAVEVSKFKPAKSRAERWAAICGSGFVKTCWDPDAGDPDRIYHDKGRVNVMAQHDPDMRAEYERDGRYTDVYPGEIACEVIEPWQLWPDPNARDGGFDDCEYVIIRTARPVTDVYNETGIKVSPDGDAQRGAERYREVLAHLASGQNGVTPTLMRSRMSDCAYQDECFVRPSRLYPNGRYIRVIGDQVIDDRDNAYAAAGCPIPIAKYDCFPMPGRFWGLSLVELLRNPQKAYNASRGHAMNMQATAGHAPVFLDKMSGIQPKTYKGLHGIVFEINANSRIPIFGQPPNMPPYIGENAALARSEMGEISAQTDPASSKLPGQLRSGAAISAIQAISNLILSASVESMFQADTFVGTSMLQLIGLFYDTPRMIQVMGPGGEIDPRKLRGADLRKHYRLKILTQPGDLDSAEARDAKLLDAVQLRALDPQNPDDKNMILKGLRFHNADDFVNAILGQENDEEREIAMIVDSGGESVPEVMPWMDPATRARVLERKLNTRAYHLYPPPVQEQLAARWMKFSMLLQQRIAAQIQQAQAMNGTPAQPGQASQPAA